MADNGSEPIDLWVVLEEAEQTVERWPDWQQRYEADVYYPDERSAISDRRSALGPERQ